MTRWKPSIVSPALTPPSPLAGLSVVEAAPGLRTADIYVSLEWNVSRCGSLHATERGRIGVPGRAGRSRYHRMDQCAAQPARGPLTSVKIPGLASRERPVACHALLN
jgi:hypothetical protein